MEMKVCFEKEMFFFENLPSIVFKTLSVPLMGTETFLTLKEDCSKIIPSFFTIKDCTFLSSPSSLRDERM